MTLKERMDPRNWTPLQIVLSERWSDPERNQAPTTEGDAQTSGGMVGGGSQTEHVCPACGYCPCCGRRNPQPFYPWYPVYPVNPVYPVYPYPTYVGDVPGRNSWTVCLVKDTTSSS